MSRAVVHTRHPSSRRSFLRTVSALPLVAGTTTLLPERLLGAAEAPSNPATIEDSEGFLGRTAAPVSARIRLSSSQLEAARQGRLLLREPELRGKEPSPSIAAQLVGNATPGDLAQLCWSMPPGQAGARTFSPTVEGPARDRTTAPDAAGLTATGPLAGTGQYEIRDSAHPILRYNYATVEPSADYLKAVTEGNRIYARARSDYLHPLFGLDGETLTHDWSADHPHHRGIYWAWPETDWRGQRGDLHALQKVFARPTGSCVTRSGPVYAEIEAENEWRWEGRDPIVRERAILRAYRVAPPGNARIVDLEFRFTALNDPVLIARRGTEHYGGLNIRLAAVRDQRLDLPSDAEAAPLRRSWAGLSGTFPGAPGPSGLLILQSPTNPNFPGDWIKYPDLNWLQPTFPAKGTRYELKPGATLTLRYRLWLHRGAPPEAANGNDLARAFQHPATPFALTPS